MNDPSYAFWRVVEGFQRNDQRGFSAEFLQKICPRKSYYVSEYIGTVFPFGSCIDHWRS